MGVPRKRVLWGLIKFEMPGINTPPPHTHTRLTSQLEARPWSQMSIQPHGGSQSYSRDERTHCAASPVTKGHWNALHSGLGVTQSDPGKPSESPQRTLVLIKVTPKPVTSTGLVWVDMHTETYPRRCLCGHGPP